MRIVGATRLTGFRAVDGTPGKDSGRRSVQISTFSDDRQQAMKSAWQFFMSFRGRKAHPNRVEKPPAWSGLRTRGQTGLAANFRQRAPEIHASLVSPGGARGWR